MKKTIAIFASVISAFIGQSASAAVVVNINQSGANVVATTTGTLSLTGLTYLSDFTAVLGVRPVVGYVGTGALTVISGYSGFTGSQTFGPGEFTEASSYSGVSFAFNATSFPTPRIFVQQGFTGGSVVGTATFNATTLAALGLTTGTYIFNSSADSLTINVGQIAAAVPEPATWAMMLVGFGMIGATARYRRRSTKVAYA